MKNQDEYLEKRIAWQVYKWTLHVQKWADAGKVYFIRYEELRDYPFRVIKDLATYLEMSLSDSEILDVVSETSRATMQVADPTHVNKVLSDWSLSLTPTQKLDAIRYSSDFLSLSGYEPTKISELSGLLSVEFRGQLKAARYRLSILERLRGLVDLLRLRIPAREKLNRVLAFIF